MKLERILEVAALAALALLATSPSPAQDSGELPRAPKAGPVAPKAAPSPKNGATNPAPDGTLVARLRDVKGHVLVSRESGLSSVEGPVPLARGARVITTAESSARVLFEDGCEVALAPNQRLEIESDVPCKERMRLAQSIFVEPGAPANGAGVAGVEAGVAGGGGATAAVLGGSLPSVGLAAAAGGLAGFAALVDRRESSPASPN